MNSLVAKLCSEVQYPKNWSQGQNTSIETFYVLKVCEMLRNTPKHHVESSGVEWMLSLRNYCRKFGTPKSCLQARNTSFASFYVSKVCEMLQNTPKHRFGSSGVEWMLLLQNHLWNFSTRNIAFTPETQVSHRFTCRRFAKCSERLPNIGLCLME